ncbi:hypothetical protein FBU59_001100 [Linderina macrospora]|uniref:Uncharacterized protein n=1 Tax=Linderina macrospora TaxID=4868 RepID=A0ACC1JES8_9FUNG|nr:hypothetical protein FBU59_001100 [Linderina macrospora]
MHRALALYLAVHESSADRLSRVRKKVDISFTLENLQARSLSFNKYPSPITVWVDSNYSTWGDDKFIELSNMRSFLDNDTACLVVRFHVRETLQEGVPPPMPTSAIAVYVPDKIAAPFNQLLKSARFSDIQFELRDSSSLVLSPGPNISSPGHLPSPRSSGEFGNGLGINQCVTPLPGNPTPKALPYAQRPRMDDPGAGSGHRYHAHKAILMQVSPVFEAMFSNGMRETFEQVVEVWDVTPRAFERLLEFAYTRQCDLDPKIPESANVTPDEVVETLLCADQFGVTELRSVCWRNLMAKISVESVPRSPFLQARSPRRKSELTREAFTPGIVTPTATSPRTSVCNVRLQSVEYSDTATLGALHARKEHLAALLPCIRFPMMDRQFLLSVVERNTELMAMPLMKDLMIEAYRFHAFNPPVPEEKLERRRASECFAKRETSAMPVEQYAKIILPLNGTDEYTLSRSQRRKWMMHNPAQKTLAQNIFKK